jgi:putative transposase
MADENSVVPVANEQMNIAGEMPTLKKQRAPRRPRSAVSGAGSASVAAAPVKGKRGRRRKQVDGATIPPTEGQPASKINTKSAAEAPKPVKSADPSANQVAYSSAPDEIADLMQLEEENQKLRKLLAEKLRAENADLRKRLGLDR